jgi:iron complex outermembrane receptor protein
MKHRFLICGTALYLALATSDVAAQTAQPAPAAPSQDDTPEPPPPAEERGGIQDIIVTAQRREQSQQDVPIAISAFTGDALLAQGAQNLLQLGNYVPNLVAQNNTGIGSANAYFLRGLGNTETIATFDPPVGSYVDDIYISRQNANNLSLFDVERVEVLRGPQGTLFGRNTTGGAINVIMRQPEFDRIGGYAELGYGSYEKVMARASVDLPLAPSFAVKVSGYWQDDRGYALNTTTGERMNDDDGWGVRLGLRGELAPWARWNGSYARINASGENILNFDCDPRDRSNCNGRFLTTGLREANGPPSPYAPLVITGEKANFGHNQVAESDLVTSNLAFDLDPQTTLSLITGYIHLRQRFALDFFDGRGGPSVAAPVPVVQGFTRGGFTILNDGQHEQFTQEIKLNGRLGNGLIDYVVGGFFFDENNRTDFADVFSLPLAPGGFPLLLADRTLRNKTTAYAGYAQADLNLGALTVTAGVRYTDEKKTLLFSDNRASCNDGTLEPTCLSNPNLVAPSGVRIPTEQHVKLWTPRFAASLKATEDVMLFASATRGFKSGGWNARGTTPGQLLPFDPEKVWSYEAGVKSDLFDRRVRANITVFRIDVDGLQTPSALVAPNGTIAFITRNFADYRNTGVEAEFSVQPVRGLNLYANVGYQDDRYIIDSGVPDLDIYGIQSVAAQQRSCQAQLAAGQIPTGTNTSPAGQPPNNAPACAAGIVNAEGQISTPVRTPDITLSIGGSWRVEMASGTSLTPTVNASYRSLQEVGTSQLSFYDRPVTGVNGTFPANPFGDGNFIVGSRSEAAWIVNAGLALRVMDERVTLSLECTNCFDETYIQSTLANYSYLNPPRTWLLRTRFDF